PIPEGVEVASPNVGERPAWDWKCQIGGGATGTVFLEMNKSHRKEFPQLLAVKVIPRALPNFTFKRYQAEIHNLQALATHEWFVKFYSSYEDTYYMYIAMEYMPMGDMSVTFADGYRWNESDTKVVIKQLLCGLSVMHKEGITHRDLKPENIFLYLPESQKSILRVKIGDFGTSKRIRLSKDSTYLKTTTGTQSYMAPEVQDTSTPKTNKVDIWSIGCILYRMVAGSSLFRDQVAVWKYAAKETPADFLRGEVENIGFGAPCISFLCHTLQPTPEDRPSAEASLQTAWIMNEVEKLDYTIGKDLFKRLSEINHQASDKLAGLAGWSPDTERTNG
ncbi:kinase-like domain-containing protein, partial [Tuber borchii]